MCPERLIVAAVCAKGALTTRKNSLRRLRLRRLRRLRRLPRGFGWGVWLWLGLAWLGLWIPTVDRGNLLKNTMLSENIDLVMTDTIPITKMSLEAT